MSSQTVNIPRDTTLQDTNSKLQAIAEIIGGNPMIAEKFSTESSYAAGEYCINDGEFEKFTAAKTAGAWDASKATETTVGEELTALNNTLTNVSETLIDNNAKIYYKVKNGIVRLRFAGGTVDLTSGSWVTYGSLPNGVRKPDETEYASVTCGANGKYAGIVMVSPAGTISYYCNYAWGGDASIKSIWGELVY